MGRKYASIHIITDSKYTSRQIAHAINSAVENIDLALVESFDAPRSPAFNVLMKMMQKMMLASKVIKENGRGYSISDGRVGMDNIADVARILSRFFNNDPILYSCVHDDDIFCFGLFQNGEAISEHISGNLRPYGMEAKNEGCPGYCRIFSISASGDAAELQTRKGVDFEEYLKEHTGIDFEIVS